MKFVYILEDDLKFQQDICEAIYSIDPKIQIRIFPRLEVFAGWIKQAMVDGPAAITKGGEEQSFVTQEPVPENEVHQLALVLSKIEFLGVEQLNLLRKTRQLFIDRKICTAEDPTAFVLTAFDDPNFHLKELENRILSNVIFKPFDRLILTQHLTFAIDGRHPPSKYTVTNQKTAALVEMLKDVELEQLTDVGFVTKSYRKIEVGAVAKYYSEVFKSERKKSISAVCVKCEPHPKNDKHFQCSFHFFAADQTQISQMRKRIRSKDEKPIPPMDPTHNPPDYTVHIVLLDPDEDSPNGLRGQISNSFKSVEFTTFPSFQAFLADLDPNAALSQRDPSLKAFGGANQLTLVFDASGATFLECESDKKDLATIFGVPLSELKTKSNWFSQAIDSEFRDKYWKTVQTGALGSEITWPLVVKENTFLVNLKSVEKEKGKFKLTLIEPSKDEQVQWLGRHSKLKKSVQVIIAPHSLFGEGAKERWNFVKESLKKRFSNDTEIIMTSKKDFSDGEIRLLATVVKDIFFKPVDRVYMSQKIKLMLPHLQEKTEKVEIKGIHKEQIIKTANPVQIQEISEAGIVMKYYRPIALGSFREIVLWQPYEVGAPELLSTCNYVEENPGEKGTFNCHLVFFGVHDHFLKHIRIWIRDNYVHSKEGQS